jgi:hypothetical protein
MSEGSFWPTTWKEAVPLIVWGVLIFAAGFEGIASLVHAEWVSSLTSFAIMVGLTAMLLHWRWVASINPNWIVGAVIVALSAIILSPFVEQQRWPFSLEPITFLWGSAALLVAIGSIIYATTRGKRTSHIPSEPAPVPPDAAQESGAIIEIEPPALRAGLYVCGIRFSFGDLQKDRHSELTMRVFNGTCRVVEFSGLSGHIKFNAPNNVDPSRMGDLPTPALRPDTERTITQLKEWLLILTQRVPADEADKLIAMREADIPILFDLSGLNIEVFAQDDRNKVERLPIWSGVSYNREHGFGMIISCTGNAIETGDRMN